MGTTQDEAWLTHVYQLVILILSQPEASMWLCTVLKITSIEVFEFIFALIIKIVSWALCIGKYKVTHLTLVCTRLRSWAELQRQNAVENVLRPTHTFLIALHTSYLLLLANLNLANTSYLLAVYFVWKCCAQTWRAMRPKVHFHTYLWNLLTK